MVKITCRDAKFQCSRLFLTYFLIIQSLTIDFSQDLHSKLDYFNWHRKVMLVSNVYYIAIRWFV